MKKILDSIDHLTKVVSENLERKVNRSGFIKAAFTTAFVSLVTLATGKATFANGSSSWCSEWWSESGCLFPNGKRCTGCSSTQSTKCPSNHSVFTKSAGGWYATGCWCVSYSWGAIACCDCIPSGKSKTRGNACGCAINL